MDNRGGMILVGELIRPPERFLAILQQNHIVAKQEELAKE
jgi:hypothetical protein